MPGADGVAILIAGVLSLWATTRLLAVRVAPDASRAAGSTARLLAGIVGGVALLLGGTVSSQPLYWAAAGVAAISTAAAVGIRLEIGRAFGAPAHAIPSLVRRPPGTPGSVSATAALTAAGGAFATASLAFHLRLLGPSDPALVALAAYVGMLFECWLEGVGKPTGWQRPLRAAAAALVSAALATALVILLP